MSTAHPKATKLQHAYTEAYVLSIVYNIHEHVNNTIEIGQKILMSSYLLFQKGSNIIKLKVQDFWG